MVMKKLIFLLSVFMAFSSCQGFTHQNITNSITISNRKPTWPGKDDETIGGTLQPIPKENLNGVDIYSPRIAHKITGKTYEGYSKDIKYYNATGDIAPHKREYFEFFLQGYSSISVGLTTSRTFDTGINLLNETCKVLSTSVYENSDVAAHVSKGLNYGVYYVEVYNDSDFTINYTLTTSQFLTTPTVQSLTVDEEYMNNHIGLAVTNGYIPGGLNGDDDYGVLEVENYVDYGSPDKWMESAFNLKSCDLDYTGWVNSVYLWDNDIMVALIASYKELQKITLEDFNEAMELEYGNEDFEKTPDQIANDVFCEFLKDTAEDIISDFLLDYGGIVLDPVGEILNRIVETIGVPKWFTFMWKCLQYVSKYISILEYQEFYNTLSNIIDILEKANGRIVKLNQDCKIEIDLPLGGLSTRYLQIYNTSSEYIDVGSFKVTNSRVINIEGKDIITYGQIYNLNSVEDIMQHIGYTMDDYVHLMGYVS